MLPKKYRLTSRGDFKGVFTGHLRARLGPFQLICRKNERTYNKFGFVVSLAVSKKAVRRNLLRRQLHAIIHQMLPVLLHGYDCVIRAHPGATELTYKEVEQYTQGLLKKVGLIS